MKSHALADIRYAFRQLAARPGFTAIASVTLAVGIAASTAIFSVVYGILLDPLPYADEDRLVEVLLEDPEDGDQNEYLTGLDYRDLRDNVTAFETIACLYNYRETGFNLETEAGSRRVRSQRISGDFFAVYGAEPILGRTFTEEDERPDARLAILSHGIWQQEFGGDGGVVGRVLRVDGEGYEVVGVMPPGFEGVHAGRVDVWIPQNTVAGGSNNRGNHYLNAVGKLREGVTLAAAQEQIDAVHSRIVAEDSEARYWAPYLVPMSERVVGKAPALLYALLAAAGLVLLIACVNLATMLLARASQRQRELATRAALGSSRGRLVRQLLTENLALAVLGGGLGMVLGMLATEGLVQIAPAALPRTENVVFDWRVFLAGAALTLVTAVLFGLIPSLRASRVNIEGALREGSRGGSAGPGQQRLHQGLIAAQVAMAVVVLVSAGLLGKSFSALLRTDLGMSPENVLVFEVSLPEASYPEGADRVRFYERLHERLAAVPGVTSAGAASWLPASGRFNDWGYQVPNEDAENFLSTDIRIVQGDYFKAMDIALLEGRMLDERDTAEGGRTVVVSESLARRHWPDSPAVGEVIGVAGARREIVGVVADTRYDYRVASSVKSYISHRDYASNRNWALQQVVEAEGDPMALLPTIEQEVAGLDPTLVIHHVRRMEEIAAGAIARERFAMWLMSAFGWIALILAVVGLYGVLSYTVAQRTREIGIRMALGARGQQVLTSVVVRALRLTAVGAIAGCVLAAVGTRWLGGLLYEISPLDAVVFAGALGVTGLAAMVACLGPAGRAVRVSPTVALRAE